MKPKMQGMMLLSTVFVLLLMASFMYSLQKGMWLFSKLNQQASASYAAFDALEYEALKLAKKTNLTKLKTIEQGKQGGFIKQGRAYTYGITSLASSQSKQAVTWFLTVQSGRARLVLGLNQKHEILSWRYVID